MRWIAAAAAALIACVAAPAASAVTRTYTPLEWSWINSPEPTTDYSLHIELLPGTKIHSLEFVREDDWLVEQDPINTNNFGYYSWCNIEASGAEGCGGYSGSSGGPFLSILSGRRGVRIAVKQATVAPVQGKVLWGPLPYYGRLTIVASRPDDEQAVDFVTFRGIGEFMAVPEPSTWALMIGGFGFAGSVLRRRRASHA
jgi:hypothetical protein